jgi:hypothetical protein
MATKDSTTEAPASIKDYTLEVPMITLEEVVEFVKKIREQGLETASMKDVAEKLGYAAATSTPFYRRLVAGRLFGFLPKAGVDLTQRATDYLKPQDEGASTKALTEAIKGIPAYADNIQRLDGKRLNLELISNGFETKLKVTKPAAKLCAKIFEQSLRFGGFLAADGVVQSRSEITAIKPANTVDDPHAPQGQVDKSTNGAQPETQTHTLYLNKNKLRKFIVTAPLDLDQSELDRITGWLGFTFLVEQPPKPAAPAKPEDVI